MNPLAVNPLAMLAGALLIGAIGFGAGWTTNGWRLNGKIAEQKAVVADEARQRAEIAVSDMAEAAEKVNDAASGARVEVGEVLEKLTAIDRRFKNAKPPQLPADCKPDSVRVQYLSDAAAAANASIARPKPGH